MTRSFIILLLFVALVFPVMAGAADVGAIQSAALMGDLTKLKAYLNQDPMVVNQKDNLGLTPLFWAVYGNEIDAAALLISSKADVNARNYEGKTPLHVAVAEGREQIVALLVNSGADCSIRDDNGDTATSLAASSNNRHMLDTIKNDKPEPQTMPPTRLDNPKLASQSIETTKINFPRPGRQAGKPGTKAVVFKRVKVKGVPVNLITADLMDARVRVSAAISKNGIETDEPFDSLIKRTRPTAAINGTFFSKSTLRPVGDIVIHGKLTHWGGMGSGICLTKDCVAQILTVERHKHVDWSQYDTVMCAGPRLLTNGKITLDPTSEGFDDPHLLAKTSRTGVGLTSDDKLILANTTKSLSLFEWAEIMRSLGCADAINFDGGASTAMFYRGTTIASPTSKLTNIFLIYEK